jgi:hypothetical protein
VARRWRGLRLVIVGSLAGKPSRRHAASTDDGIAV